MRFSLFKDYGALNSKPIFEAFEHSLRKAGHSVCYNDMNADVAVIWSVLFNGRMSNNRVVWERYRQSNRNVVVLEVGGIKRNTTWKVGLNGINRDGYFGDNNNDNTRAKALGLTYKPWKSNGNFILVCGQHDKSALAASLAAQGEARHGSGSTLIIAIGQEDGHWRQVAQAALNEGLQVLRARDGAQLASLLASEGLGQRLRLLLPASGEEADALRRLPALKAVPRHQILPADRLTSPFLSALLGGSETDTVMLHQFHKDVPLEHFVATMLKAGKSVSVLHGDEEGLREGQEASLTLMAAWAAKDQAPQQPEAGAASAWPLALHG